MNKLEKENALLKRKIKFLKEAVKQSDKLKTQYDEVLIKLKKRDKKLESVNIDLEKANYKLNKHLEIEKKMAITDALTNLYNRRYFDFIFEQELNRAKRQNYNFSLLMLDVDNFKLYNDTYGHQKGDEVLAAIGNILLKHAKRANDFSFRIGGEEFACISSFLTKEEILTIAKSIKKDVEDLNIKHEKNKNFNIVTMSIGVTTLESVNNYSKEQIYKITDNKLYLAKKNGRNQIVSSTPY